MHRAYGRAARRNLSGGRFRRQYGQNQPGCGGCDGQFHAASRQRHVRHGCHPPRWWQCRLHVLWQPKTGVAARYAINGIFNSLDFSQPVAADVRIAGLGPTASVGFAQLSLSIQLDLADSRLNRQMSMVQRPVQYSQVGVGSGREWGGTLVTGNLALQNQERLQLEALNGPIALGVVDVVMKEFPRAGKACGHIVKPLLKST